MVGEEITISLKQQVSYRMINSKFPPITLFDDVVDEDDFETAYALQALTNPRILNELGDLTLITPKEIPFGINGTNYATAPFTHINPDGSRFSDGSFGILYLADSPETAIAETRHHQEIYFRNIKGLHYDTVDMRCIKFQFSANINDAKEVKNIHSPNDYEPSRLFGTKIKKAGGAGIEYRSVRNAGATCWGLMSPSYVESAHQTQHFEFVFDGEKISKVRELTNE